MGYDGSDGVGGIGYPSWSTSFGGRILDRLGSKKNIFTTPKTTERAPSRLIPQATLICLPYLDSEPGHPDFFCPLTSTLSGKALNLLGSMLFVREHDARKSFSDEIGIADWALRLCVSEYGYIAVDAAAWG